jgi:hypothetical protein
MRYLSLLNFDCLILFYYYLNTLSRDPKAKAGPSPPKAGWPALAMNLMKPEPQNAEPKPQQSG